MARPPSASLTRAVVEINAACGCVIRAALNIHFLQRSVHWWDDTLKTEYCARATVETLGLQARRRLQRTYCTVQYLENAVWPPRLPPFGCTGEVLSLLAWFIPHAEWKVNESLHPDCATIKFGKSWVHRSGLHSDQYTYLNGENILNFPVSHHCILPLSKEDIHTNYDPFDTMTSV